MPGDTSGTLGNDSGNSMSLFWWLVVGSTRTSGSLPTAWEATATADEAAGMTANIAASTNSEFYLTGLQFEVGEKATPFEHRSYGDELQRCERYLQQWKGDGTPSTQNVICGAQGVNSNASACFLVPSPKMRGPFSVEFADLIISDSATYDADVTAINLTNPSSDGAYVTATHAANGARSDGQSLRVKSGQNGYLRMISEL